MNQHNEYYMGLRARANAAGDDMARSFDAAHAAYEGGDGARAKELSNAGKAAQKEMERLNEEASEWIFRGMLLNHSLVSGLTDMTRCYSIENNTVCLFASWTHVGLLRSACVQDSQPGEIDLHGLYVKEAIRYADRSIQEARARGDSKIRFIVGESCAS